MSRKLATLAFLSGAACLACAAGPLTIAAKQFNATLGVVASLPYSDGTYGLVQNAQGQWVLADRYVSGATQYLGLDRIRSGVSNNEGGASPLALYQALATEGLSFTFINFATNHAGLAYYVALDQQIASQYPGHILSVEGPNEINALNGTIVCWYPTPQATQCDTGLLGAEEEQLDLQSQVNAAVPGVALDYFTGWGAYPIAVGPDPVKKHYANDDNAHPYPNYGEPPFGWMTRASALGNTRSATEPAVFTEIGYSACNDITQCQFQNSNEVDETTQAKQTLDIPLDAVLNGISDVYLYELLEAYASEASATTAAFGLFRYSLTGTLIPRPAAVALHNMAYVTQDSGHVGHVAPLAYQVQGLPAAGYCPEQVTYSDGCTFTPSLALQKSNGHYVVVVWAEQKIWDSSNHVSVTPATYVAKITLPRSFSTLAVYDPMISGTNPVAAYSNTASLSVQVVDHPILIDLTP